MNARIRNEHLQWTVDRLRLDHVYQVLEETDRKAMDRASSALLVESGVAPSRFGEVIRVFSEQERPRHSHILFSETGELLLQFATEDALVAEAPQLFKEMWHTEPGTLFLGLAAWFVFPYIGARWEDLPYMPAYWIEHFVEEKEALSWQDQTVYFTGVDKALWEIREGEWIRPLFEIGQPNLTARSLNRIRMLVDMFRQAEANAGSILEREQQRLAMSPRVSADIEEALKRQGSGELPPVRPWDRDTR